MKRGDILTVRGNVGATTKARPCVVVQRASTLDGTTKITACPLSSTIVADQAFRPILTPSEDNGLRRISQVEADWIFTEGVDRFGTVMGSLDPATMLRVDAALKLWLDL